jgi:BirA family biotin operon repressor/biotin-[acetyl-CoA-carboxylase] ligase
MEALAAGVVDELASTCVEFESGGFARFADRWPAFDWLLGKDVVVDDEARSIEGMAAGVDRNGALLVQTKSGERHRVMSGSIRLAKG